MWEAVQDARRSTSWFGEGTPLGLRPSSFTSHCRSLRLLAVPEKQDNRAFAEFLWKLIMTHLFNRYGFVYARS